ncbi:hypothetical protein BCR33DRAFT_784493 [Rhizoclosmatium globosum]|uniref:Leucine-rich repeat-containing N-terminal plant-type domain-containing protein n=1 Tax=Rhizoclosmatium globosum TaxID=329046 RepID=A0A1Y2CFC1_9FUNG|nr:hypothetical protein BCR33DRAFT_784493 [Rhizoclosmatium globosum]|eukprot:ORY45763.1 hypothetical protein BCR33DRAFT_784493 [Rhizoclosmatium globosum]
MQTGLIALIALTASAFAKLTNDCDTAKTAWPAAFGTLDTNTCCQSASWGVAKCKGQMITSISVDSGSYSGQIPDLSGLTALTEMYISQAGFTQLPANYSAALETL